MIYLKGVNCKVAGKIYCAQKLILIAHSKAADKVHIAQFRLLYAQIEANAKGQLPFSRPCAVTYWLSWSFDRADAISEIAVVSATTMD